MAFSHSSAASGPLMSLALKHQMALECLLAFLELLKVWNTMQQ